MIFAAWDASTTAVLIGIPLGLIGTVSPAIVALYAKFSAAGLKAAQDHLAMETATLRERNQVCEDRNTRLEARVDALESRAAEAEKLAALWQLKWQIATGSVPTSTPSSPPKNASE
jgi:outer membrane murein-binding lipoprotein Lpp